MLLGHTGCQLNPIFIAAPFEGFGFALPAPRRAVQKKRMPFLAAATLLAVRAVKGARFANGR